MKMNGLSLCLLVCCCFTATAAADTGTRSVTIKSVQNDRYVRAGIGANTQLGATSTAVREWEEFDLIDLGGQVVALRSRQNCKYVGTGTGPDKLLAATSTTVGNPEKFELARSADGYSLLRSVQTRKYVRAGIGNSALLGAVSDRAGGWEKFLLTTFHEQTGHAERDSVSFRCATQKEKEYMDLLRNTSKTMQENAEGVVRNIGQ